MPDVEVEVEVEVDGFASERGTREIALHACCLCYENILCLLFCPPIKWCRMKMSWCRSSEKRRLVGMVWSQLPCNAFQARTVSVLGPVYLRAWSIRNNKFRFADHLDWVNFPVVGGCLKIWGRHGNAHLSRRHSWWPMLDFVLSWSWSALPTFHLQVPFVFMVRQSIRFILIDLAKKINYKKIIHSCCRDIAKNKNRKKKKTFSGAFKTIEPRIEILIFLRFKKIKNCVHTPCEPTVGKRERMYSPASGYSRR